MKRQILAVAVLGLGFAMPAFAAKADRSPVVYGARVGSSTMLKPDSTTGSKRAAGTTQATATQAKAAASAPVGSKKKAAKKSGVN